MRVIKNFNYDWQFNDNYDENYIQSFNGKKIELPHTIFITPLNSYDENKFLKVTSYKKDFFVEKNYENKTLILKFDGVAHYAQVFINGNKVGEHKGGYTAFELDITSYVRFNETNSVFVKVDSSERSDIPPFGGAIDYQCFGGIYREVSLIIVDNIFIKNVFIKTPNALEKVKSLNINVILNTAVENVKYDFSIIDIKTLQSIFSTSQTKNGDNVTFNFQIDNVSLWEIDSPKLYQLVLKTSVQTSYDELAINFGFRQAIFTKNGFYLNGKKIKLIGLNRHQSYPYIGYSAPRLLQYDDAEFLKNTLGVNIVRTSHYPQSQHFINKCDELGLLVFTEISGWGYIGDKNWQDIAVHNVQEMVEQNFNHPSIILWGVRINESEDNERLYKATNSMAHLLDDSRQTGGVRCNKNSQMFEDVYTYNDFVHNGFNKGLEKRHNIIRKKVPYLVSEHNGHMYSTKSFDGNTSRLSQAFRHLNVMESAYKYKQISGAIGWCMSDYNTHYEFGSGDKICYHGVSDMFRIPKLASYAYLSQQDKVAVLELGDDGAFGDKVPMKPSKQYIFSNCDTIKVFNNEKLISTLKPNKDKYKYLPHPPFQLDNIIGDELNEIYGFKKGDIPQLKSALVNFANNEQNFLDLLVMARIMLKYHLSISQLRDIGKAVCMRWRHIDNRKYEGYINDKLVITKYLSPSFNIKLQSSTRYQTVIEKDTYEIFKIEIKAINKTGQVNYFIDEVLSINVIGVGELIGESEVALIGGVRGIYVRTIGKSGKISVIIKSNRIGENKIEVEVVSNGIN